VLSNDTPLPPGRRVPPWLRPFELYLFDQAAPCNPCDGALFVRSLWLAEYREVVPFDDFMSCVYLALGWRAAPGRKGRGLLRTFKPEAHTGSNTGEFFLLTLARRTAPFVRLLLKKDAWPNRWMNPAHVRSFRGEFVEAERAFWEEAMVELERLPPIDRRMVEMWVFEGESFQDIADLMDVPKATVASQVESLLATLKAAIPYNYSGKNFGFVRRTPGFRAKV
jgi:hypothetical protein